MKYHTYKELTQGVFRKIFHLVPYTSFMKYHTYKELTQAQPSLPLSYKVRLVL